MADKKEIVTYFMDIFQDFKSERQPYEDMWKECGRNYRGEYRQTSVSPIGEGDDRRSKVFVKLTGQKCHTIHSKIIDTQLSGRSVIPYSFSHEDLPEGMAESDALAYLQKLKKNVDNHFIDIRLDREYSRGVLGLCIDGSGVIKDPVMRMRYVRKWVEGKGTVYVKEPFYTKELVNLLNYYADFHKNHPSEGIAEIQMEKVFQSELEQLMDLPGYDKKAIKEAIAAGPVIDDMDDQQRYIVGDMDSGKSGDKDKGYYVWECWGLIPRDILERAKVSIPPEITESMVEVMCSIVNRSHCIKIEVNQMGYRPFLFCPFEETPGQSIGQGVAWAVRDMQTLVNVFVRMLVDNKKLTSQGMFAINREHIDTTRVKDFNIESGKIWWTKGNIPVNQVMQTMAFTDISNGLFPLIEFFLKFADDETVPKYTQGSGDSFLNKTATGISMLLTQSMVKLKTVMKNIDFYWVRPMVERTLDRIEEMSPSPFPIKVIAEGTDSLMAKEMKMEKLMQFMQFVSADPTRRMMVDEYESVAEAADYLDINTMKTKEQFQKDLQAAQESASKQQGIKESLNLAALYPMMTRDEQTQILQMIGVQPSEAIEAMKQQQLAQAAQAEEKAMNIGRLAYEADKGRGGEDAGAESGMEAVSSVSE